jgi:DNA-binding XRE family transcriptional regulator
MNKALLKSIIALHGDTTLGLAKYLGLSRQSLYNKMNETGKPSTEFKQGEIAMIRDRYKLNAEEVEAIFFS